MAGNLIGQITQGVLDQSFPNVHTATGCHRHTSLIDPEALIYGVILTNEPMGMENRRPMEFASCRAAFRST